MKILLYFLGISFGITAVFLDRGNELLVVLDVIGLSICVGFLALIEQSEKNLK